MEYVAKVVRVVDGDTLDVDIDLGFDLTLRERVRLYGINTPETRSSNPVEKAAGMMSHNFLLETLLEFNNDVKLVLHGEGKFGRPLADVYIGKDFHTNVNHLLISEGYAHPYFGGKR